MENKIRPREGDPVSSNPARVIAPPVDIYENAEEYLIVADLPGVAANDVQVRLERNLLSLEARRVSQANGGAIELLYRRQFSVPAKIENNAVEAELKDGVLSLHLPKAASERPREIAVRKS